MCIWPCKRTRGKGPRRSPAAMREACWRARASGRCRLMQLFIIRRCSALTPPDIQPEHRVDSRSIKAPPFFPSLPALTFCFFFFFFLRSPLASISSKHARESAGAATVQRKD